MPAYVAILFSLFTPIAFTTNGILTKHLTNKNINPFDPHNLSFTSYAITNIIILLGAIPYWIKISFSPKLFFIGMIGSFFDTLGHVCCQIAYS